MASGHVKVPHQQAEHMAAPTSTASTSNKSLANREPSTHGLEHVAANRNHLTGLPHEPGNHGGHGISCPAGQLIECGQFGITKPMA